MEEVLKNVLIKEAAGPDKVFIVDNLPKRLLYHRVTKMQYDWQKDRDYPAFKDVDGKRVFTGEKVDELLPGIEHSLTGDGGYVFFTALNAAKEALERIDDYIKATMPPGTTIEKRVFYSSQPGNLTAGPKPLDQIPRVALPEPATSPTAAAEVSSPSVSSVSPAPAAALAAPKRRGRPPRATVNS
jgi:hypothetical protein